MAALTCQEMVELVTDYLEGNLGWRDRRRVRKHLRVCDACTQYIAQMRETLDLLGTVPVESLSPQAQSTLLDAFRDLKR
jgi:predicted anti-sigma-YlaC factor YlaD